jgi:hypothetical protein
VQGQLVAPVQHGVTQLREERPLMKPPLKNPKRPSVPKALLSLIETRAPRLRNWNGGTGVPSAAKSGDDGSDAGPASGDLYG